MTSRTADHVTASLVRGGMLNLAGLVVGGLFQLVLAVVVTRGLGPSGAGIFFEAVAVFMILSNTGELGADTGLVRTLPRELAVGSPAALRPTLMVALIPVFVLGVAMAAAVYVLAPPLVSVFFHGVNRPEAIAYVRALAPFLPLASAATVALAGTRGYGTMAPFVLVQNVALPVVRPILILAFVLLGLRGTWVAYGWSVPLVPALVVGIVVLSRLTVRAEAGRRAGTQASVLRSTAVAFWRFAAPRGLAAIFGIAITWLDVLLVGALASTYQAGIYAALSRLAIVGVYALQAVGMALAPTVSHALARGRPDEASALFHSATEWIVALTWPFYLALAVGAPLVLAIFGAKFVLGSAALTILSLSMLINVGTGNLVTVLLMAGASSLQLVNTAVSLAVNVVLNLVLIPRLGITGAAISWGASIAVLNLSAAIEVWIVLRIQPFSRTYVKLVGSICACYLPPLLAARLLWPTSLGAFAVAAAAATIAYVSACWRMRDELQLTQLVDSARSAGRRGP